MVLRIRQGIKAGNVADGLVAAIGMCGELLERGGVEIRPDDINELSDDVRKTTSVHGRAMRAFVEEEIFSTRERTGILLFISLLEHRIEVVGDTGINQKVTPDEWTDVVVRVREGIKAGKLADGLVAAIEMCGELLERVGVEIRPDDINELSDDVRLRDDE